MNPSRRRFLARWRWAPMALLPAPLGDRMALRFPGPAVPPEYRLSPRYRERSPLEAAMRNVEPGLDAFLTEKYASEIEAILAGWRSGLLQSPPDFAAIEARLAPAFRGSELQPSVREETRPPTGDLSVRRGRFSSGPGISPPANLDRDAFSRQLRGLLTPGPQPETASRFLAVEFEATSVLPSEDPPAVVQTRIRYDLVQTGAGFHRAERAGHWELSWAGAAGSAWQVQEWRAFDETSSAVSSPVFADITAQVFGGNSSYREQLLRGAEYWRTVLDGACGIDVYGNNGIAAGDINNDGFDDLYVCQPAGLPNRLYRNRGDGTFEDVTDAAGVGVLDDTPCALLADLDNDGRQDLIVVRADGPLLFVNQGGGRFRLQPDAFRFAEPPQGTFTGAAVADYNRDGWLDVYFCLYSYYQGLEQYRFPTPYDDAENGPPNFLLRNNGDRTFTDVTAASALSRNNHRYSFACGWCDYNHDGWPDLYVANDFGRKNLYRNNGDGTFADVAPTAGVEDVGAGMSVCWFDYDNDNRPDLYVADMWTAAGQRVSQQPAFLSDAPPTVRRLYQKHARGNSLFHLEADEHFGDASAAAGVERGRWAWSSDAWDFDHDGYPDLYIANGMISGPDRRDLASFFWRQVVARSPLEAATSPGYQQGWNAINELIRADGTWSGYQRNVFYVNNRDGTFSDVAGTVGLDFLEDSRAFALSDFDHDGRLEVFLKNRGGPQLRALHNEMRSLGGSIVFRLRGHRSNRDAIGAAVTVEAGKLRQTRWLQAGSGFLSQHTKELFFGLGQADGPVRVTVRWPSGLTERFENVPAGHRIFVEEGAAQFHAEPFRSWSAPDNTAAVAGAPSGPPTIPTAIESWLIAPLEAPGFALPDLAGRLRTLESFRGRPLLLYFWAGRSEGSEEQLLALETHYRRWAEQGLRVVALNVDGPAGRPAARSWAERQSLTFPLLWASDDIAGVYNLLYRYLFDRRRDLGIPTSFLLDEQGSIVKVYQGRLDLEHVDVDFRRLPRTPSERLEKALPFRGHWYGGEFHHNQFTYGVAFFQRGYPDQAIASFQRVIAEDPANADAYYNLGTLYLRKNRCAEARQALERVVKIKPDYPDAWNNLGMVAAEEGRADEAIRHFQKAIEQNPHYTIALENLGNLYRSLDRWREAQQSLERARALAPDDPEVNYSLGMLFAQQDQNGPAQQFLEKALALRPDYPEALNNLGVLYLRTGRASEAIATWQRCTRVAPDFGQAYWNLARVYAEEGQRGKARQLLARWLAAHPDDAAARKALDQLSR